MLTIDNYVDSHYIHKSNWLKAAVLASGASFTTGGVLLLVILPSPVKQMEYYLYGFTVIFLIVLGANAARAGGSDIKKKDFTPHHMGNAGLGLSAMAGYLFGTKFLSIGYENNKKNTPCFIGDFHCNSIYSSKEKYFFRPVCK